MERTCVLDDEQCSSVGSWVTLPLGTHVTMASWVCSLLHELIPFL
jgi:hypothetical protein